MARKSPKLSIVPTIDVVDVITVDVSAMVDALQPLPAEPDVCNVARDDLMATYDRDIGEFLGYRAPPAPVMPSLAMLETEAAQDVLAVQEDTYTLVITGQYDSMLAAGMFAGQFAKLIGSQVCVVDASGTPVRCYDPPARRGRGERGIGGTGAAAGPRGADWGSKSGQAIKLMMRDDGATMDEMREITGWTFGKKYVAQLMRSFGVAITTKEATARTKRTWHAALVTTTAHLDDTAADDDAEPVMLAAE